MRRFLPLCGLALLHFFALSSAIYSYTDALATRGFDSFAAVGSRFLARVLMFPVLDITLRSGYFPSNAATFYFLVALNSFAWALFLYSFFRGRRRKKNSREYSQPTALHAAPATTHVAPPTEALPPETVRADETSR